MENLDIQESKDLKEKATNFYKDLFTFAKTKFNYVIFNGKPWIRGKDAALYLLYKKQEML